MAQYGLGNFVYELTFDGKTANFKFHDPADITNTAEVSVPQGDFPGDALADSRQVADLAYGQVAKLLNDKRDSRLAKEAQAEVKERTEREAKEREIANDFFDKSQEIGDQRNYEDNFQSQSDAKKSKDDKKK